MRHRGFAIAAAFVNLGGPEKRVRKVIAVRVLLGVAGEGVDGVVEPSGPKIGQPSVRCSPSFPEAPCDGCFESAMASRTSPRR